LVTSYEPYDQRPCDPTSVSTAPGASRGAIRIAIYVDVPTNVLVERLAGRWAANEAVINCFDGTGICFPRRRIEVLPAPNGAPKGRLLGDHRGARVEVSITHHSRLAVATAHLEMPDVADNLLPAPDAVILPERPRDAHKGTFGTAIVLAGSLGFTGAAYLASTAAARTGAGLVRLLVADTIYPILAAKCTEVMATPVPEVAPGAVGHAAYDSILRQMSTAGVGVIGPGLGHDSSTDNLIRRYRKLKGAT